MPGAASPGRPGRPKDAAKRALILATARDMFFRQGPDAVTIEAVAAAAGVSRTTVYGHFHDKAALFAEVIAQEGQRLSAALAGLCGPPSGQSELVLTRQDPPQERGSNETSPSPLRGGPGRGASESRPLAGLVSAASEDDAAALRRDLVAFGCGLVRFLSDPQTRAFNRLMEAQSAQHPDLARAFAEAGPRAVVSRLAERLRRAAAAGLLAVPDAVQAARHLIGLFRSADTSAVSLGVAPAPAAGELERYIAGCVEVFLRAYGP